MEHRGPILLLFSALLIMSPIAIRAVKIAQNGGLETNTSVGISTDGSDLAECAASTFTTSTYTLGCGATRQHQSNRRQGAGGSLRISMN